jgi:hypothetical protein
VKQYFSCIDTLMLAPQPEQHALSQVKASKEGGQIVFYGAEEHRVVKQQPFILGKLLKTPGLDGVVFFSVNQFCYADTFNLKLLAAILEIPLEVHFAREDLSFRSITDMSEKFLVVSAYFHAYKRSQTMRSQDLLAIVNR